MILYYLNFIVISFDSKSKGYPKLLYINNIMLCRIKGPNYILGLGPCPRAWVVLGEMNSKEQFRLKI